MLKYVDKVNRIILQIVDGENEIESNLFYINEYGTELLSEYLINNTTLKHLNLNHNNIKKTGVYHLAKALYYNSTLLSLRICCNNINDEGCEYLAKVLYFNNTLQNLDIRNNNINYRGIKAITTALLYNSSIINIVGIILNSFQCRQILNLPNEFSKSSNIEIIKHLKDINWIRREYFIKFLIQILIINVNDIALNIKESKHNRKSISFDELGCLIDQYRKISVFI